MQITDHPLAMPTSADIVGPADVAPDRVAPPVAVVGADTSSSEEGCSASAECAGLSGLADLAWKLSRPVEGTASEKHLLASGLIGAVPAAIRHLDACWSGNGGDSSMIALVTGGTGTAIGVACCSLDPEGRSKQPIKTLPSHERTAHGAIRLDPAAETIVLASTLIEGLAIRLVHPSAHVWVTGGSAGLARVELPERVRRVVVCARADEPGRFAAAAAVLAHVAAGREAMPHHPALGTSFIEEWLLSL